MQTDSMIQLHGITKSFGSLQVLRGIDLQVNRGEVVAIVGPSGAGKTTLLQIMGTLDRPDEGEVIIDGENVSRLSATRLRTSATRTSVSCSSFTSCCPNSPRSKT